MNRAEKIRNIQPENGANMNLFLLQRSERGESSSASEEHIIDPRKKLVEWWKNAPEKVIPYGGGTHPTNNYEYGAGQRLLIGDLTRGEEKQVMDTCETPWAFATVDKAFAELTQKTGPVKVLERGFGMGLTARRVIQNLITRGGEYTVIELNKGNAEYAREWIRKQKSGLTNMASGLPGTRPDIDISIIEGESYEEGAKLVEAGRKFDIIISDTFPLSKNEEGINDLQDLGTLKRCLESDGVFTFFAYFPGFTGDMTYEQVKRITTHFRTHNVDETSINPPPDYRYLQTDTGPVRSLPIVICKFPKL